MTFTCREMQHSEFKGFFQLEIVGQSHTHQNLNELLKRAIGTLCQTT